MGRVSSTQLEVILKLTEPGSPGVLERWPGGFWTVPGAAFEHRGGYDVPAWHTGTQTVRSMERHGLLRRTGRYPEEWKDDRELTEAWLELGLSLAPNPASARQLEAERAYGEGVRSTAQHKIRRHRERIAELEAQKRTELSNLRALCADQRRSIVEPIDAEEARLREDIDRTRDITAIQTGRARKAAGALRHLKRREAQQESDDAVERDIDASLVPVWRRVKRQFVDTPRMSRSEAFLHWVEEHPEEVALLQEQIAMPSEESLERAQWSEEARAAVQSDDDEIPFN